MVPGKLPDFKENFVLHPGFLTGRCEHQAAAAAYSGGLTSLDSRGSNGRI
jgi:hypothetical protein